jgi:hypothetical protein
MAVSCTYASVGIAVHNFLKNSSFCSVCGKVNQNLMYSNDKGGKAAGARS